MLLQVLGPERLLWGSDWPCTNHEPLAHYASLRGVLDEVLESPQLRHQVLTQNPHRLYA
jgi:predicted TIM-barrel fold metal-dependent hydrolase